MAVSAGSERRRLIHFTDALLHTAPLQIPGLVVTQAPTRRGSPPCRPSESPTSDSGFPVILQG